MKSYLYCGSSKLIAKHSRVEVFVEKANCSWAVCINFEVGSGKCNAPNGCLWRTGSRAEWSRRISLGVVNRLVYKGGELGGQSGWPKMVLWGGEGSGEEGVYDGA